MCTPSESKAPAGPEAAPDLGEILRRHAADFGASHELSPLQYRVLRALASCRTAALGGHLEQCDRCGHRRAVYHSCRNRHCPKCQLLAQADWLEARRADLLPIPYFHVVFTLPQELRRLALAKPRLVYDLLFRAASETLQTFARDPKHLGGELGLTAILHTWGQTLSLHPHLHCVVTGGALAPGGSRWIATRHPHFLFPVRALAQVFRGKFLAGLRQRFDRGELGTDDALPALLHTLRQHDWVVYAKPPFAGPESVLRYLGRYTHRIALSNRRILRVEADQVALRYRDYADGSRTKVLALSVHELLRRFLPRTRSAGLRGAPRSERYLPEHPFPDVECPLFVLSAAAERRSVRPQLRPHYCVRRRGTMHVDANGIRIHYRIDGREGAPWVTFITGIANDTTMWDGQMAALAEDFRLLRYDSRGHGGTQATAGDYSFDLLMGDLLGLWDALGIRASHLVGLGLGGATAIGLGIQHSDRLLSLVPCCCRAEMTPTFAAVWPVFIETVKAHGMEGMVEPTVQRWFTDDFKAANPAVLESVRAQIRGTDPLGYYGCIAALLTLAFADRIDRIRVPTLFISGADDFGGGPPEVMQSLAAAVPGARHVSLPHAAHICNIQNPEAFNRELGAFLRAQAR